LQGVIPTGKTLLPFFPALEKQTISDILTLFPELKTNPERKKKKGKVPWQFC